MLLPLGASVWRYWRLYSLVKSPRGIYEPLCITCEPAHFGRNGEMATGFKIDKCRSERAIEFFKNWDFRKMKPAHFGRNGEMAKVFSAGRCTGPLKSLFGVAKAETEGGVVGYKHQNFTPKSAQKDLPAAAGCGIRAVYLLFQIREALFWAIIYLFQTYGEFHEAKNSND